MDKKIISLEEVQNIYTNKALEISKNPSIDIKTLIKNITGQVTIIMHTAKNETESISPLSDLLDHFEDMLENDIKLFDILKEYIANISSIYNENKKNISWIDETVKEDEEIIDKETSLKEKSEEESIEQNYIFELFSLFESAEEKLLVKTTLAHIYKNIEKTIEAEVADDVKDNALKNILTIIDLSYLKNNSKAIELLKILIWLKINKYNKNKKEEFHVINKIPEKCRQQVKKELIKIVTIDYLYKAKCELFIEKLDEQIPYLLQTIEKKQNPSVFFAQYVLPILIELDIPISLHLDFLKIVDIYFQEKNQSLLNLSMKELYYWEAELYLKKALSVCDKKHLNDCKEFVIYLQQKFIPWLVTEYIAQEIEKERIEKDKKTGWVSNILSRIHEMSLKSQKNERIWIWLPPKIELDKPNVLEKMHPYLLKNKLTPIERAYEKSVNDIYGIFPYIPEDVKKSLRPYVKCYFNYCKTLSKIGLNSIDNCFNEAWDNKKNIL